MVKKTALLLLTLVFLATVPCHAMQMAAHQATQTIETLDETTAKELIQKLLGKKYNDMVREVSKLSDKHKEFIKAVLNKNHPLSTVRVHLQQVLSEHNRPITSVAFSPDGHFALTGSRDHTACLWDLTKSPITTQRLTGHRDWIRSVAFSPNSRFALTGSDDATARLWDLKTSPIISQKLIGHMNWISSVSFSPGSKFALTGRSWNCQALGPCSITGHKPRINHA